MIVKGTVEYICGKRKCFDEYGVFCQFAGVTEFCKLYRIAIPGMIRCEECLSNSVEIAPSIRKLEQSKEERAASAARTQAHMPSVWRKIPAAQPSCMEPPKKCLEEFALVGNVDCPRCSNSMYGLFGAVGCWDDPARVCIVKCPDCGYFEHEPALACQPIYCGKRPDRATEDET